MRASRFIACVVAGLAIGLTEWRPAAADEGMWLLNRPAPRSLKEKYNFEPSKAWLEHLQRSCIRTGASASLVSAEGLVMTNHHVGSDALEKLSTPDHNLLKTGFYARTRAEELKCPDTDGEVLQSIEDVTDRVNASVTPGLSDAEANKARKKAMTSIEAESDKQTGLHCTIVTLYHGARYHMYRYKRYTDLRLVFAPEEQIAFFGGDNDNFEYPRFNLDCCFFRVYENGRPLKCTDYLKWSRNGAADGELTFVLGNPGRTQRLYTVDHLKFLRDVEIPSVLARLWRREVQSHCFAERSDEFARIANGDVRGVENSRKAFQGILAGLQDPALFQAKMKAEAELKAAVNANPEYKKKWGDAWDRIAAAETKYREFYLRHSCLEGRRSVMRSDLLGIARHLVRMADEKRKPNAERLREYTDAAIKNLELDLFSPAPIYDDLEIERISSGLAFLAEALGADDPAVTAALNGKSPRARAQELVHGTQLKDVALRRKLAAGGSEAIASSTDAMIRFMATLDPTARALRKRYEDEVESVERDGYSRIGAAMFAVYGEDVYPDATFTLRLAYGPIRGYTEDGKTVPPFTTFAGMYERMEQRHGTFPFNLPQRWIDRKNKIKLDTPFNFVNNADIIGGNSGSPVVNKAGEVVGLIFDGNIQSLIWDIAFTDEQGRAVAVDSRALIEAIRNVYDAGPLADELMKG